MPFNSGQEFIVPENSLKPPSEAARATFLDRGVSVGSENY